MKAAIYILSIACIVFIAMYLSECQANRDSRLTSEAMRSVWEADKVMHDKEISLRDSFLLAEKRERIKDLERHAKEQSRLHGDLKASKRRERLSRTDTMIVNLTDTIYLKYDTLVADLTNERDSMKISYESSIDSLKANESDLKAQIKLADSIISLPVPKQSRVSLSISAGYGLMSTGGQVRSGVYFGPGISYNIPIGKISLRKLFRKH